MCWNFCFQAQIDQILIAKSDTLTKSYDWISDRSESNRQEVQKMLKHVHLSPYRSSAMSSHGGSSGRADTVSLNSTMSCSSLSQEPLSSRSSSYNSLTEPQSPTVSPNHLISYNYQWINDLQELYSSISSLYWWKMDLTTVY